MTGVNCSPCHHGHDKSGHLTLGPIWAWKRVRGWPCKNGLKVSKTASSLISSFHAPRWPPPMSEMEVSKKTLAPLFLYHLLAFCPPPPVSSASIQDRNGGRLRTGGPRSCCKSPSWLESPFFCKSFLGSRSELKILLNDRDWNLSDRPCWIFGRHYLKAVQIIVMIKNSYAEFVHASSKTMQKGDKKEKSDKKMKKKKKKKKGQ